MSVLVDSSIEPVGDFDDSRQTETMPPLLQEKQDIKGRLRARRRKAERKEEGLSVVLRQWIMNHQTGISINLVVLLFLVHTILPRARPYTRKFFELSYQDTESGLYRKGPDDFYLVCYWMVLFTGLRAAFMDYVFVPLAEYGGVSKKKGCVRFAEQAWLLLYYSVFWTLGMYLFYISDYWLDLKYMWIDWPHPEISGLFKWYYLAQLAFWFQQIVVVNIEERRKDHHQMFTHHILTCGLILGSYGCHHMRIGNVIMCIMDIIDILLPAAKMLKYLHFEVACNVAFGLFMLTWMVCKHGFYFLILWSFKRDLPSAITFGCYSSLTRELLPDDSPLALQKSDSILPNVLQALIDPDGIVCFNERVEWAFLAVLLGLQAITLVWYAMIVRVAWKIVKGGTADDSRSDDEDDEEDEEEDLGDEDVEAADLYHHHHRRHSEQRKDDIVVEERVPTPPLEEEVGVEDMHFESRRVSARALRRRNGQAAGNGGVSLPGSHSDKKELLGRIGCEKTTT